MPELLIGDFHCGTKSATVAFDEAGDEVVSIDINPVFFPTICKDIRQVKAAELFEQYGRFDFIWNSPDCSVFCVPNFHSAHFRLPDPTPLTWKAKQMIQVVEYTKQLMIDLNPRIGWVIENPRGLLHKLPVLAGIPRVNITYCSYADTRMKPTMLWGRFPPSWLPREPCFNENPLCDHERAPAGSHSTGTNALPWEQRIQVPRELSESFRKACIGYDHPSTWKTLERWSNG
jgi:hypothetical protein